MVKKPIDAACKTVLNLLDQHQPQERPIASRQPGGVHFSHDLSEYLTQLWNVMELYRLYSVTQILHVMYVDLSM